MIENIKGLQGLTAKDREEWDKTYSNSILGYSDWSEQDKDRHYRDVLFQLKFKTSKDWDIIKKWSANDRDAYYEDLLFYEQYKDSDNWDEIKKLSREDRRSLYINQPLEDFKELYKNTEEYKNPYSLLHTMEPETAELLMKNNWTPTEVIDDIKDIHDERLALASENKELLGAGNYWQRFKGLMSEFGGRFLNAAATSAAYRYGTPSTEVLKALNDRENTLLTEELKNTIKFKNQAVYDKAMALDRNIKKENVKDISLSNYNSIIQDSEDLFQKDNFIEESNNLFDKTAYGTEYKDTPVLLNMSLEDRALMISKFYALNQLYGPMVALDNLNAELNDYISKETPPISKKDLMDTFLVVKGNTPQRIIGAYNIYNKMFGDDVPDSVLSHILRSMNTLIVGNIGETLMALEGAGMRMQQAATPNDDSYDLWLSGRYRDEYGNIQRRTFLNNPEYWSGVSSYGTLNPHEIDRIKYGFDRDEFQEFKANLELKYPWLHGQELLELAEKEYINDSWEQGEFRGTGISRYKYQDYMDSKNDMFTWGTFVEGMAMTGLMLGQLASAKLLKAGVGMIRETGRVLPAFRNMPSFGRFMLNGAFEAPVSTLALGQSYGLQAYEQTVQNGVKLLQEYYKSDKYKQDLAEYLADKYNKSIENGLVYVKSAATDAMLEQLFKNERLAMILSSAANAHNISAITEMMRYGAFRSVYQKYMWGNAGRRFSNMNKYFKNGTANKPSIKGLAGSMGLEMFMSGFTNYLDEANTAFSAGIGALQISDYLGGKYSMDYNFANFIPLMLAGLDSADDKFLEDSSLRAFSTGFIGGIIGGSPINASMLTMKDSKYVLNLPNTRENYKEWNKWRKALEWTASVTGNSALNNLSSNLAEYDTAKKMEKDLAEIMNLSGHTVLDINHAFQIINDMERSRLSTDIMSIKDADQKAVFSILHYLYGMQTTIGGTEQSDYQTFIDHMEKAVKGEVPEDDITGYINNKENAADLGVSSYTAKYNIAKQNIQRNAQKFLEMSKIYTQARLRFDEEYKLAEKLNDAEKLNRLDFLDDTIYKWVMSETFKSRLNNMEETLHGGKVNNSTNQSVSIWESRSKSERDFLLKYVSELGEEIKSIKEKLKKEKEKTNPDSKTLGALLTKLHKANSLYDKYLEKLETSNKLYNDYFEKESEIPLVTADEIINLNPYQRDWMFSHNNEFDITSKLQRAEIDKATAILKQRNGLSSQLVRDTNLMWKKLDLIQQLVQYALLGLNLDFDDALLNYLKYQIKRNTASLTLNTVLSLFEKNYNLTNGKLNAGLIGIMFSEAVGSRDWIKEVITLNYNDIYPVSEAEWDEGFKMADTIKSITDFVKSKITTLPLQQTMLKVINQHIGLPESNTELLENIKLWESNEPDLNTKAFVTRILNHLGIITLAQASTTTLSAALKESNKTTTQLVKQTQALATLAALLATETKSSSKTEERTSKPEEITIKPEDKTSEDDIFNEPLDDRGAGQSPTIELSLSSTDVVHTLTKTTPQYEEEDLKNSVLALKSSLDGNYLFGFNFQTAVGNGVILTDRIGTTELSNKFYEWVNLNNIKFQDIIDFELGDMLGNDNELPVRFMIFNPASDNLNIIVVTEVTDLIRKVHNNSRGGIIKSNGKEYLVLGCLGFNGINQAKAYNYIKARLTNSNYFESNSNELYYVGQDIESTVSIGPRGRIVSRLPQDSSVELRTLSDLLNDEARNPDGLTFEDLIFAILKSVDKPNPWEVLNTADPEIMYGLKAASDQVGSVFLGVKAGDGKYVPVKIQAAFYNTMREGKLKDKIDNLLNQVTSDKLADRLEAIKSLVLYLYMDSTSGPTILVGSEKNSKYITVLGEGNVELGKFEVGANFDRLKFLDAINKASFRINVTPSVLTNPTLIKLYDEAGCLMTDIACLRTRNAKFDVNFVGLDGKAVEEKVISQRTVNSATTFMSNPSLGVVLRGETYYYDINSKKVYKDKKEINDHNIYREVVWNAWILMNKILPIYKENGMEYYTNGEIVISKNMTTRNNSIQVYTKEQSKEIIERINIHNELIAREEAAKKTLSVSYKEAMVELDKPMEIPVDTSKAEKTSEDDIFEDTKDIVAENLGLAETKQEDKVEVSKSTEQVQIPQPKELNSVKSSEISGNFINFADKLTMDEANWDFQNKLSDILNEKPWAKGWENMTNEELENLLKEKGVSLQFTDEESFLDELKNCIN